MALRRCPVILADDFVPPAGPDWNEIALFFPQKKVGALGAFLFEHEHQSEAIGARAYGAWMKYFHPAVVHKYVAHRLVEMVSHTPRTTGEGERRRWNSLDSYWSNHWTLPQRALNKAKKWSRISSGAIRNIFSLNL
jgi:hypothetical protein